MSSSPGCSGSAAAMRAGDRYVQGGRRARNAAGRDRGARIRAALYAEVHASETNSVRVHLEDVLRGVHPTEEAAGAVNQGPFGTLFRPERRRKAELFSRFPSDRCAATNDVCRVLLVWLAFWLCYLLVLRHPSMLLRVQTPQSNAKTADEPFSTSPSSLMSTMARRILVHRFGQQ